MDDTNRYETFDLVSQKKLFILLFIAFKHMNRALSRSNARLDEKEFGFRVKKFEKFWSELEIDFYITLRLGDRQPMRSETCFPLPKYCINRNTVLLSKE